MPVKSTFCLVNQPSHIYKAYRTTLLHFFSPPPQWHRITCEQSTSLSRNFSSLYDGSDIYDRSKLHSLPRTMANHGSNNGTGTNMDTNLHTDVDPGIDIHTDNEANEAIESDHAPDHANHGDLATNASTNADLGKDVALHVASEINIKIDNDADQVKTNHASDHADHSGLASKKLPDPTIEHGPDEEFKDRSVLKQDHDGPEQEHKFSFNPPTEAKHKFYSNQFMQPKLGRHKTRDPLHSVRGTVLQPIWKHRAIMKVNSRFTTQGRIPLVPDTGLLPPGGTANPSTTYRSATPNWSAFLTALDRMRGITNPSTTGQLNTPERTPLVSAIDHPEEAANPPTTDRPTKSAPSGYTAPQIIPLGGDAVSSSSRAKPKRRNNRNPRVSKPAKKWTRPKPTRTAELTIKVTRNNLTNAEMLKNQTVANTFIDRWRERKIRKQRKSKEEWNPTLCGHKLMDLELPADMIEDCIFDSRHLVAEDIANIQVHEDPLVELYKTLGRIELMEQTRDYWRTLRVRPETDPVLQAQIDMLAILSAKKKITPFKPLANFLESWYTWRLLEAVDGPAETHKHKRPVLWPNGRFLLYWGAEELRRAAKEEMKAALDLKGVVLERLSWKFNWVKAQVKRICNNRQGVTYMLNSGALEALQEEEDEIADTPLEQEQDDHSGSDRNAHGEVDNEALQGEAHEMMDAPLEQEQNDNPGSDRDAKGEADEEALQGKEHEIMDAPQEQEQDDGSRSDRDVKGEINEEWDPESLHGQEDHEMMDAPEHEQEDESESDWWHPDSLRGLEERENAEAIEREQGGRYSGFDRNADREWHDEWDPMV